LHFAASVFVVEPLFAVVLGHFAIVVFPFSTFVKHKTSQFGTMSIYIGGGVTPPG
jgi:energy-converting hydrogenase Eha subunit F